MSSPMSKPPSSPSSPASLSPQDRADLLTHIAKRVTEEIIKADPTASALVLLTFSRTDGDHVETAVGSSFVNRDRSAQAFGSVDGAMSQVCDFARLVARQVGISGEKFVNDLVEASRRPEGEPSDE